VDETAKKMSVKTNDFRLECSAEVLGPVFGRNQSFADPSGMRKSIPGCVEKATETP